MNTRTTTGRAGFPFARRPVPFTLLLVLAVIVVYVVAGALTKVLALPTDALLVLANGVLLMGGAALLVARGGVRGAGVAWRPWGRAWTVSLPLFLPALVTLVLALVLGGDAAPASLARYAGLALLVGAAEETIFRGLAYGALRRLGVGRAVLLSAAAFGVLHLLNVARGASPVLTVLQVLYAFALGCAYAAALERGGHLVPLVAAHAATDLLGFVAGGGTLESGGYEVLTGVLTAAYVVVFGGYAWWLVRRRGALTA